MYHEAQADYHLPGFRDPQAAQELWGYDGPHIMPRPLPGTNWETGNMFEYVNLFRPNVDMDAGVFTDTVWRFGHPKELVLDKPEDAVLQEVFFSDAIRRLQAVEQLTLMPEYTTIPNTAAFSRFEHIWGSVLFVRQMAEQHEIEGREAVRLQLRTLVSDVAHTFGSHLGDWMFQGVGGPENQHDLELMKYLEAVGITDILRRHNYDPADVVFPEINDWVESSQPDLCVDRVDYGLREMNRWNEEVHSQAFSAEDFMITPEGMLAMKDQQKARIFSEGFLLLSQEHWSEPTHRFMLDMLMLRTKLFYAEGHAPRSWVFQAAPALGLIALRDIHPRDLMYVTEPVQADAYALPNLAGHTLEAIMKSIAGYHRQYVWPGRKERLGRYMRQFTNEGLYAEGLHHRSFEKFESIAFNSYGDEYPPNAPNGFAVLDAETAAKNPNAICIDFPQPPFKARQIDPLVQIDTTTFKRLSEIDPTYAVRLAEHKQTLQETKVARLALPDPNALEVVRSMVANVEAEWRHRLETSRRMSAAELRELVAVSSRDIFGSYPFMTFDSYH